MSEPHPPLRLSESNQNGDGNIHLSSTDSDAATSTEQDDANKIRADLVRQ